MPQITDPNSPIQSARFNRLLRQLDENPQLSGIPTLKKGGKVKKTGVHKLHKGEKVITAKAAKKMDRKPPARRGAVRARKR